jgi:riboflavin kinase/FMN adenylyltransferase
MKYQNFVKDILVHRLKVKKMVIGYDHAFGRNREGHAEQLKEMGKKYDFNVTVMKPFLIDGEVVNSTRIRQLLKDGEVLKAQGLLGRKYSITGIVERGNDRGKSLGIPTANLRPVHSHKLIPKRGVYAVDISFQNKFYKGMMNIGYRPTFNFDPLTLEVHIFNFTGSIYGEQLEIQLKKFIRDERKFKNVTQLKNQMLKDKEICYKL